MANVLVLENDEVLAGLIASVLEREGHMASVCMNAEEAYSLLVNEEPDFFITDLFLKGMGGDELIKKMHMKGINIPTAVISGFIPARTSQELIGIPFVKAVFKKPFDLYELAVIIENQLEV